MGEENISQEFKIEKIEIRNFFNEKIDPNELINNRHKWVCTTLDYLQHFLILAPAITECVPISAFVYLDSISIGIRSSAVGLTIYATTAAIKKQKKKKKKKHDKRILLAKNKLDSMEVLISKALTD